MLLFRYFGNKACTWLLLGLILFSCTIIGKKYLIPEKNLIPLLVDIHLADGMAISYRFISLPDNLDSTVLYSSIFEKHGVSRMQFDSTMSYYTNHPDDLNKIYEKVIERLSKLESEIRNEEKEEKTKKETVIWEDSSSYMLPADGRINRISFNVAVSKLGEYTIHAKIKVFNDDESIAPKMNAFFWHDNDTADGYSDYFKSKAIKKDKNLNNYEITKKLHNKNITHIKGNIYDHSNQDSLFSKHAYITGIKITHKDF